MQNSRREFLKAAWAPPPAATVLLGPHKPAAAVTSGTDPGQLDSIVDRQAERILPLPNRGRNI